ncbi:DUF3768 domain-containing protein [Mesorhizobium sp. CAU 1741]|uniref:DUF3768 domain-containing protein n=1 Tax=Mesorhizobium sp. CAU 1741 TaxID=3140366 RepID=UPI00325C2290
MFDIDPIMADVSRDGLNKVHATRRLNDTFRRTFAGGTVVVTPGVRALDPTNHRALLKAVQTFDAFATENDPYEERDFGAVEHNGERYFWKIDYYDLGLSNASPDPSDPELTIRVMTIMRADEY